MRKHLDWLKYRWEFARDDPSYDGPLDPSKSWEELIDGADEGERLLNLGATIRALEPGAVRRLKEVGGSKIPDEHLVIYIKPEHVASLTALKKAVGKLIDYHWRFHGWVVNWTDFDVILQVGRLKRDNLNITWEEIAKKVWPKDELPTAAKKAIQHYNRYKDLISGGWRKLTPL